MRYFNVLVAAAVAALITLPVQAQDFSRSNMVMKSTGFGNSAPVKPETGCPLMLWENKNGSVVTHDMIQLTRDARQIRQIMWNGQGYRIVFGPGAFQDGGFRTKVEKPLGIISFGCVDGGIAELTVTDCADGRPLADASVSTTVPTIPRLARDLRTDAAGRVPLICSVCSLPETTDLTVGKTGYVEQKDKLRFVGQVIERPVVCLTRAGAVATPQPAELEPQPAAPNVVTPPAQIPDGLARNRSATDKATGHAYASSAGSTGWTEAERLCREQGGHLATITSRAENDFVAAHFNGSERIWLGGSDAMREGQWQWITGEPVSFRGFGPDEPNDNGSGEDYLELGDNGEWNDDGMPKRDREFFFLCEWEPH